MKKLKSTIEWNKVTPLSKYLAMAIFVALPFIGFFLGMKYQQKLSLNGINSELSSKSPSPVNQLNETKNNKVYRNSKYGFNLEYPSNWVIRQEASDFGESTIIGVPESAYQYVQDGAIFITVLNIGKTTIDNFMNQNNPSTGDLNKQTFQFQKNIEIDGEKGIVTSGGCCGLWGHFVFLKKNSYLYEIGIPENTDEETTAIENLPIIFKILSSFKFTN